MPSDDVVEFGGWPQPPKWVWAAAGIAVVAALVGVAAAHTGSRHAAASAPSRSPAPAASPTPAGPPWPSAAGACGSTVDLPQIRLAGQHAHVHARLLIGGTGLREVTPGGAVSAPLPGLPERDRVVTSVVAGPGAAYAFDTPCSSSTASVRIYRITASGAHRLGVSADALIGGPHLALALSYRPSTVLTTVLNRLAGSRAVRFRSSTDPIADTAAGLVVVRYRPLAGQRHAVELVDPNTGAVLRRIGEGFPMGAADHVLLVSLHGCTETATHSTCTLESFNLNTGRPIATINLPAGQYPTGGDLSSPVFSRHGTLAAFQLARAKRDPRFAAVVPDPPSDVAVLNLRTGKLDAVPGLELPPATWAGLAFDPTGRWLLATVSEGGHGELLAWRPGMPGPALVTSLPGPLAEAPPLLLAPSWWR
ncbi:MAG TPA: hypothetical protein VFJ07_21775 [Streptosporangiaceae bacterium]|nr:hypothetical protein [Streptosporangiaceae bacterium]